MDHHCNCRTWAGGECTCAQAQTSLPLTASHKFVLTVGRLIKGQIRRELESVAFMSGLELDVQESNGCLESNLYITVKGEALTVSEFCNNVKQWADNLNAT